MSLAHLEDVEFLGCIDRFTVPSGHCRILAYHDGWHEAVNPINKLLPRQLAFRTLLPHWTSASLIIQDNITNMSTSIRSKSCRFSLISLDQSIAQRAVVTEDVWLSILDAFSTAPLTRFCIHICSPQDITSGMWSTLFGRFPLDTIRAGFCGSKEERGYLSCKTCSPPRAHRIRTLDFHSLTLNPDTTGAILDLLEDRDGHAVEETGVRSVLLRGLARHARAEDDVGELLYVDLAIQ
ncbi:hypothetical protein LXA43DRAFT_1100973 [Ganoderma leucocontextum]|nr:hypothetical protein LXA43DRAFT_1100973 [Ganoderma leucocontextum]